MNEEIKSNGLKFNLDDNTFVIVNNNRNLTLEPYIDGFEVVFYNSGYKAFSLNVSSAKLLSSILAKYCSK